MILTLFFRLHFKTIISRRKIIGIQAKLYTFFSGTDLLIFRDEFKKATPYIVRPNANKILVSMGGSDPYHLTELISDSLELIQKSLQINYILGAGFTHKRLNKLKLKHLTTKHTISYHYNVKNIADHMMSSDIAIINGGNTRFELALIGIPFISVSFNNAQNEIANKLQIMGIGENLGVHNMISSRLIADSIINILTDFEKRLEMSKKSRKIIHGHGAFNIFTLITKFNLNKS